MKYNLKQLSFFSVNYTEMDGIRVLPIEERLHSILWHTVFLIKALILAIYCHIN